MATAAPWHIALRLHIVLALLTAASATGSALFLMYLARPYIVGQVPYDITALGGVLLLGAVVAGVLAALVGLAFGTLTSRRIRGLIRRTEALLQTDTPQVPHPATDELGVLQHAFGQLTLSIDRFVRDSEILAHLPLATTELALRVLLAQDVFKAGSRTATLTVAFPDEIAGPFGAIRGNNDPPPHDWVFS